MSAPQLEVLLYGEPVVRIDLATARTPQRRVEIISERYRECTAAWLQEATLTQGAIARWLLGLRPEGGARRAQDVAARERLGRVQQFGDVYEVGQAEIVWALPATEYAGAVSFRSLLASGQALEAHNATDEPLSTGSLDRLLDRIKREMAQGNLHVGDPGVPIPSSSGSMPKVALHLGTDDRWYLPRPPGRLSTHILKLEERPRSLPGEATAEAVCQRALQGLGVRACTTRAALVGTGRQQAVISERSDRQRDLDTGTVRAVHQEEWASACGADPDDTWYRPEIRGGFPDLYRFLMHGSARPDVARHQFWSALAATVLLGHRDLHKRNIGIQYAGGRGPGPSPQLAPLYDVSTIHGCSPAILEHAPIPIDDEHRFTKVGREQWRRLALACGEDEGFALSRLADVAARLPEAVARARSTSRDVDETNEARTTIQRLDDLTRGVERHCAEVTRELAEMRTPVQGIKIGKQSNPSDTPKYAEMADREEQATKPRTKCKREGQEPGE